MASPPSIQLQAIHRIVADGSHNAFTDLIHWRGRFYLTFRSCSLTWRFLWRTLTR